MRRITRVGGAVLFVSAVIAVSASPAAAVTGIDLTVKSEDRAPIVSGDPGAEGRTIGYWGKFVFTLDSAADGKLPSDMLMARTAGGLDWQLQQAR